MSSVGECRSLRDCCLTWIDAPEKSPEQSVIPTSISSQNSSKKPSELVRHSFANRICSDVHSESVTNNPQPRAFFSEGIPLQWEAVTIPGNGYVVDLAKDPFRTEIPVRLDLWKITGT